MTSCGCGCSGERCDCCVGTQKLTPVTVENRPGLDVIRYRVGTHGAFLETMKARLAEMAVDAPGPDGQTIQRWRPLAGLTTRDPSDPAIALLDGWATVGDVLTFYQERIANEGYLRTATERRSVLELARLVGYAPRPGVAATAFLAYTVDEHQSEAVQIPIGTRSQTVPGPDELPQTFETSDVLDARSEWNNLQVRLNRPTNITLADALSRELLYAAGTATGLKKGDPLLLSFGSDGYPAVMRTVRSIEPQFDLARTRVELQAVSLPVQKAVVLLQQFIAAATVIAAAATAAERTVIERFIAGVTAVRDELYLGFVPDFASLAKSTVFRRGVPDELESAVKQLLEAMATLADIPEPTPPGGVPSTNPSRFETALLRPAKVQARNALALERSLQTAFGSHSDALPQLAIHLAPKLHDQFYAAWRNATVSDAVPSLDGVYAPRVQATRFGANAARQPTYFQSEGADHNKGELEPAADWTEWTLEGESDATLYLDQAYQEILPDSLVVVQRGVSATSREVRRVLQANAVQRNAYGLSGKSTKLTLSESRRGVTDSMAQLRSTLVYAQSEKLPLADEPVTPEVVSGSEIALDRLYGELAPGRWVIVSGERADIDEVSGVRASELLMISNVRQDYDPLLPGDKTRTTLILATPTAYSYWRSTVTIYGNVVRATNGETRHEPLGGGDGSQPLQAFALKQTPLTYVSAPNARGVKSTLAVYVNDVEWHESASLAELGPKDRRFITRTDDAGVTTVVFGTGEHGARLPTGLQNVQAVYRNGIGAAANARAEQISLMQTRPLGVRSVINPLRASGGADRESRDQARINAPLAVMSLDRLVSVADYADFTRTFAGIGKALARKLSDGREQLVHVTIAGADDIPIDPESDLYRNLVTALEDLGDPDLPLQVAERELETLVLSANIELAPDYQWDPVVTAVRASLLDAFGFQHAELGRPVLLSQIISRMQAVPGVAYVDVDAFGGVDERVPDPDTGERQLISLEAMSAAIAAIAAQTAPARRVDVNLAAVEGGRIRPAQLAVFAPAVPDTLILNQIP